MWYQQHDTHHDYCLSSIPTRMWLFKCKIGICPAIISMLCCVHYRWHCWRHLTIPMCCSSSVFCFNRGSCWHWSPSLQVVGRYARRSNSFLSHFRGHCECKSPTILQLEWYVINFVMNMHFGDEHLFIEKHNPSLHNCIFAKREH